MQRKVQQVHRRHGDDGLKEAGIRPEQRRHRARPPRDRQPPRARPRQGRAAWPGDGPGAGLRSDRRRGRRVRRRRVRSGTDRADPQATAPVSTCLVAEPEHASATERARRRWRPRRRDWSAGERARRRTSTRTPAPSSRVTATTARTAAEVPRRHRARASVRSPGATSASTSVPPVRDVMENTAGEGVGVTAPTRSVTGASDVDSSSRSPRAGD